MGLPWILKETANFIKSASSFYECKLSHVLVFATLWTV